MEETISEIKVVLYSVKENNTEIMSLNEYADIMYDAVTEKNDGKQLIEKLHNYAKNDYKVVLVGHKDIVDGCSDQFLEEMYKHRGIIETVQNIIKKEETTSD